MNDSLHHRASGIGQHEIGTRTDAIDPDWLWLGGILAIALILRVINLDAGLWYDEIDTLVEYVRLPTFELLTSYHSLNNHMLFSLEAQLTTALFGENAWALRLPAMLMGLASIWALWLLAREIVSPWEARLSTLLLAVSYHHVWFSQNARGYTGLLFWGLIATYFLVRGSKNPTRLLWSGYGLAFALSMYTHLSAIFLFAAHGLSYLGLLFYRAIRDGKSAGRVTSVLTSQSIGMPLFGIAVGGAITLLLYAPILAQMVETFSAVRTTQPDASEAAVAAIAKWHSPVWMIQEVVRSFGALGPVMGLILIPAAVVLVFGLAGFFRTTPILPWIFVIHIPLTVIILSALSFRVWPRYFFVDIGYVCLFLVQGSFVIGRLCAPLFAARGARGVTAGRLGIAFTALGVAASLVLLPKNYLHPKQDFVGARDLVETQRAPDAQVLTLGLASMPFAVYYAPQWRPIETLDELESAAESGSEVWLVYTFPAVTERRYEDIAHYVSTNFKLVQYFPGTLGGGGVVVFRQDPK